MLFISKLINGFVSYPGKFLELTQNHVNVSSCFGYVQYLATTFSFISGNCASTIENVQEKGQVWNWNCFRAPGRVQEILARMEGFEACRGALRATGGQVETWRAHRGDFAYSKCHHPSQIPYWDAWWNMGRRSSSERLENKIIVYITFTQFLWSLYSLCWQLIILFS